LAANIIWAKKRKSTSEPDRKNRERTKIGIIETSNVAAVLPYGRTENRDNWIEQFMSPESFVKSENEQSEICLNYIQSDACHDLAPATAPTKVGFLFYTSI
jgi:hypothetical protein